MKSSAINKTRKKRVGIYAGSFDPVHAGHLAFALQAIEAAGLDTVVFVPERRPRYKPQVTHYAHRVAMIRRASKPHVQLGVLEMEDVAFSVAKTMPRLGKKYPDAQLVLLLGSDVLRHIGQWPHVDELLREFELCIGLRAGATKDETERLLEALPRLPKDVIVLESKFPEVQSSKVRQALHVRKKEQGLLRSVIRYAKEAWLYV